MSKPQIVSDEPDNKLSDITEPLSTLAAEAATPPPPEEDLDADEAEFRALRRDLPGVKGASAAGIVAVSVGKSPTKNEFFRTHPEPDYRPIMALVEHEFGMEKHFFAVTPDMIEPLHAIGITCADHVLYLTVTSRGAFRIVPVRCANMDGEQNEYARTKEIGMRQGMQEWVRIYTDTDNKCHKVFPAPAGRFGEPQFPMLKPAKIIRYAFRDKGRLIDSSEHSMFLKWVARDGDAK